MGPKKRPAEPEGAGGSNKKAKASSRRANGDASPAKSQQRRIDGFFTSPRASSKAQSHTLKKEVQVIALSDSDSDAEVPTLSPCTASKREQELADAELARKLAREEERFQVDGRGTRGAGEELARKPEVRGPRPADPTKSPETCFQPSATSKASFSRAETPQAGASSIPATPPASTSGRALATTGPPLPPKPPPLDTDIFAFDPRRIDTSSWPRRPPNSPKKSTKGKEKAASAAEEEAQQGTGVSVPYGFLVAGFVLISSTRSRLSILTVLTNVLRTIIYHEPAALLPAVYLITNHVAPAYEGVELGVGSQVISNTLKAVTATTPKHLKALWNRHGDPGDVAFEARSSVRTLFPAPALVITSVYSSLLQLAGLKGQGTVAAKTAIVQKLLVSAKGEEVRYIIRTVCRNLRIGAVKLTVTAALARAFCLTRPRGCAPPSPPDPELVDSGVVQGTYWVSEEGRQGIVAVSTLKGKQKQAQVEDPKRLGVMAVLSRAEKLIREVYCQHPNYSHILPALLDGGLEGLRARVPLAVGTPLSPMLGQITRDLGDVASRLGPERPFVAEWKYDGQRVQIHARMRNEREDLPDSCAGEGNGGKWVGEGQSVYVRLFSRHLEDMTEKYPDVANLIPLMVRRVEDRNEWPPRAVESFIVDAEVCAIEPNTGVLLNFQTLANRARKDVKIGDVKVRVGIFAFDLMYLNGRPLLTQPFRVRRGLLKSLLPQFTPPDPMIARFDHVASLEGCAADLQPIKAFMSQAVENKCEGIMVKVMDHDMELKAGQPQNAEELALEEGCSADDEEEEDVRRTEADEGGPVKGRKGRRKALLSSYEPDKRVDSWLKVKKDYGDMGDSLDLVPIGAWHGQGRKAGWWSPILLALYNPESGGYQAVCKCMSGFSDQFYKDLNVRYEKGTDRCSTSELAYVEPGGHVPDVWFLPSEVWEIRGADLTLSPVYKAAHGLVDADRGLSLRFPRFYKVRADKGVEEALHPEDLAALYRAQEAGGKREGAAAASETVRGEGGGGEVNSGDWE